MQLKTGNIDIENPSIGARAYVEKAVFWGGVNKKALTQEQILQELAGVDTSTDIPGKFFRVDLANTIRDRHNEVIPTAVLQKFANDINREAAALNQLHDRLLISGVVVTKAWVEQSPTGSTLKGYIYVWEKAALPTPTTDGKGLSLIQSIESGATKDVSIEFRGYTQYVSPESGNGRGVWQYEIDPERPEDTEFTGLAIVPKGAQRGASVVKSLDGGSKEKATPKIKNMIEKIVGGGQKYTIEVKDGAFVGIDTVEKALDDTHKRATDAEAAKLKAETDLAATKADADEVRKSLQTDCINYGKLNGKEPKPEDLAKLSLKGLFDLREATLKEHDAPAKVEGKAKQEATELKGFFTK